MDGKLSLIHGDHIDIGKISISQLKTDTDKWKKEVEPIIGKTDILIYPFGSDIQNWQKYTNSNQKFTYLENQGFHYFCNVDATSLAWMQKGDEYLRQARINVDGLRMKETLNKQSSVLDHFFSTKQILDPARKQY